MIIKIPKGLKLLLFIFLFLSTTSLKASIGDGDDLNFFPYKSNLKKQSQIFVHFNVGMGLFYKSLHMGMANSRLPLQAQFEVVNSNIPISFLGGSNYFTRYVMNDFQYSPSNFYAGIKYSLLQRSNKPLKWSMYTFGAAVYSRTYLTDIQYSEIVAYTYKDERDANFGFLAGIGLAYRIKSIDLQLQYQYLYTTANFIAGYFEKKQFYTGSHQIVLMISFRRQVNKNRIQCPAYKSKF